MTWLALGLLVGGTNYTAAVREHLSTQLRHGLDTVGPRHTRMWLASLDTRELQPLRQHTPARVYRRIGAPDGVALYWDQPLLVAAYVLGGEFAQAADDYVSDFLKYAAETPDTWMWGNHRYWDAYKDEPAPFSGGYHELRNLTPAWDIFWRLDPARTEAYLRHVLPRHLYDPATGGFNRHDDAKRSCAFIESGGVLVETWCWLAARSGDRSLLEPALRVARYSYRHRGETTGIIVNNPDQGRWDALVGTTEVGVWANSLLRAAELSGVEEFRTMAAAGVKAYLAHGWDEAAGRYRGQLAVTDGSHVTPDKVGYWPRAWADPWNPDQWPTHDYPMVLADACATLSEQTGEPIYGEALERFRRLLEELPRPRGVGAYAENYGRAIHWLTRAGRLLSDDRYTALAINLADEALERLRENGLFMGHPGSHVYAAVDGVGYLCLALLELDGLTPDLLGFGW